MDVELGVWVIDELLSEVAVDWLGDELAKAVCGPDADVGAKLVNALPANAWIPCKPEEGVCRAGLARSQILIIRSEG